MSTEYDPLADVEQITISMLVRRGKVPRQKHLDPSVKNGRRVIFDRERVVIMLPVYPGNWYEFDLELVPTRASFEKMINHVSRKIWFTDEIAREFNAALKEAFQAAFGVNDPSKAWKQFADENGNLDWRKI